MKSASALFGSFAGYGADLSCLPDQKLGIVMLSSESRDGGFPPEVIARYSYDRFLQIPDFDEEHKRRVDSYMEMVEQRFRPGRNDRILFGEPVATPDGVDRESFVGEYANERFGVIKIEDAANGLRARWGNLKSWLLVNEQGNFVADFVPGDWSSYEMTFRPSSVDSPVMEIDGEQVVFEKQ